jgi:hypothetical protein
VEAVVSSQVGGILWPIALAASLLGLVLVWATTRRRAALLPATLGLALLVAGARGLPPARSLAGTGFILSAAIPIWSTALPADGVTRLTFDTYLSNGIGLAAGTPVATATVRRPDGTVHRHVLRAGSDTADWAARREPLAAAAPAPWTSFVTPEDGFLGQIYRAAWHPAGELVGNLSLERHPGLPRDVEVSVLDVAGIR